MKPETPLQELPFPDVERCFTQRGDDASRSDDQWNAVSDQGFWRDQAKALFAIVQAAQHALRSSPDFLVQRELARIDDGSHPHHFTVSVKRAAALEGVPPDDSTLPESLVGFLADLVKRDDIRSVSCWENDYPLWKILVEEQLRRSDRRGVRPSEALELSGPDGGLSHVSALAWGADIHTPYEGVCDGDIFFLPDWRQFDVERAGTDGSLREATWKHCRYLITKCDFGELGCAVRQVFGDWVVYRNVT